MAKEATINLSAEDKKAFTKYCSSKKIYQKAMMRVLVSLLEGEDTYGTLKLNWKVIGEHLPKNENEAHIRDIALKLLEKEEYYSFWDLYAHIQQTLGLEYSQLQINFVVEACFCAGLLDVDSDGDICPGTGKRVKARKGVKARFRTEWKDYVGLESKRDMDKRLGG